MPLAVRAHRDGAEYREQEHPEHDRAVQTTPVRRHLVEQWLDRIRVAIDVRDRIVLGHEGMDDDGGGEGHQRRDEVEGTDAALGQPSRSSPGADDRRGRRVATHDERGEEDKRPREAMVVPTNIRVTTGTRVASDGLCKSPVGARDLSQSPRPAFGYQRPHQSLTRAACDRRPLAVDGE